VPWGGAQSSASPSIWQIWSRRAAAKSQKARPVVVVSHEAMNRHLDTVVVCPLTTQLHPRWRSRLRCKCQGRKAEVAVDQIRAISMARLCKRLDRLKAPLGVELRALIGEMYGS
jgi:mRNA interferase MazF